MKQMKIGVVILAALTLGGCVSMAPSELGSSDNLKPVDLNAVRDDPEKFRAQRVRLGGEIASVTSLKESTVVEIVSRDLSRNGRPVESDDTEGRFLAVVKGFLDPANYEQGRALTVVGVLSGNKQQNIGEHPYQYPVVTVESHHLWKQRPEASRYDTIDFWFYGPWYGYGHHGYRPGYHPFWGYPYDW